MDARWIDAGRLDPGRLHAAYAGLAAAQPPDAAPIVLWARAGAHISLGPTQDRSTVLVPDPGVPVVRRVVGGGAVWIDEHQACYACIVPVARLAGATPSAYSWALGPAVRTLRAFGLPARRRGGDVWVGRRKIAGSGAATVGHCVVVASSFLLRFPAERFAAAIALPTPRARAWLREGLARAMTDWESEGTPPSAGELAATFRDALARTLGWRLRPCTMGVAEAAAIAAAERDAVDDEDDWLRSAPAGAPWGGLKLNARSGLRIARRGRRARLVLTVDGRTLRRGDLDDSDD